MNAPLKVVFVDRDGTLVEEPADNQVDRLEKIRLVPGVIPALLELQRAGFALVMVSNQDGLGTNSFPEEHFRTTQQFILDLLASQGIRFDAICICPHLPAEGCNCRKPKIGMLREYLATRSIDRDACFVIGDRDTDLEFARNLGITGLRLRIDGAAEETWDALVKKMTRAERTSLVNRKTKETDIRVEVNLDRESPIDIHTGIGFLDHMIEQIARHGGFALQLNCNGDLHIDEHHTVEDSALAFGQALKQALGDKRGIGRYGFVLPMDEAQARVAIDLSGRPYAVFEGKFNRERVGELPTELVPHFFRSLGESLGAAIQIHVAGENTHHMIEACFKGVGRALRQALRREGTQLPSSKGVL